MTLIYQTCCYDNNIPITGVTGTFANFLPLLDIGHRMTV